MCAVTGFTVRLIGFALASSAESDAALNPVQYLVPILVIIVCASYIVTRKRIRFGRKRREKTYRNAQTLAESA